MVAKIKCQNGVWKKNMYVIAENWMWAFRIYLLYEIWAILSVDFTLKYKFATISAYKPFFNIILWFPVHGIRGNKNWDKFAPGTNMKNIAENLCFALGMYISQVQERIQTSKKTSDVSHFVYFSID